MRRELDKNWKMERRKKKGRKKVRVEDASGSNLDIYYRETVQLYVSPLVSVIYHSWHVWITPNFRYESIGCVMKSNSLFLSNAFSL